MVKGAFRLMPIVSTHLSAICFGFQITLIDLSVSQESLPLRQLALAVGVIVALAAGITLFVLTRKKKK